jgi:PAS domain S-box-containing protein
LATTAASLERTNVWFGAALSNMSQGLCMFDAERRLVISNRRFREIYGYPEELVRPGTPLASLLEHSSGGLARGGKTLEQELEAVATERHEIFVRDDGHIISIVRTPTADGGWVATHDDVTEQKHAERRLADQAAELRTVNARFGAAINNMSQGLCLTGADRRVVMANHRFCEIYGLPEQLVQPGLSAEQLIREVAARGFRPEGMSVEQFASFAPERRTESIISPDGRTIAISRSAIPDGGWIATHEDVTPNSGAPNVSSPTMPRRSSAPTSASKSRSTTCRRGSACSMPSSTSWWPTGVMPSSITSLSSR